MKRAMIPKYGSTLLPIHVARAIGSGEWPNIDPVSPKNAQIEPLDVDAILGAAGVLQVPEPFEARVEIDGVGSVHVHRDAERVEEAPVPWDMTRHGPVDLSLPAGAHQRTQREGLQRAEGETGDGRDQRLLAEDAKLVQLRADQSGSPSTGAATTQGLAATLFHAVAGSVPFPRPKGAREAAPRPPGAEDEHPVTGHDPLGRSSCFAARLAAARSRTERCVTSPARSSRAVITTRSSSSRRRSSACTPNT